MAQITSALVSGIIFYLIVIGAVGYWAGRPSVRWLIRAYRREIGPATPFRPLAPFTRLGLRHEAILKLLAIFAFPASIPFLFLPYGAFDAARILGKPKDSNLCIYSGCSEISTEEVRYGDYGSGPRAIGRYCKRHKELAPNQVAARRYGSPTMLDSRRRNVGHTLFIEIILIGLCGLGYLLALRDLFGPNEKEFRKTFVGYLAIAGFSLAVNPLTWVFGYLSG